MIGHIHYSSIPASLRKRAASRARDQIRDTMTGNFLSTEQAEFLRDKLAHLDKWEHGQIPSKPVLTQLPPNRSTKD